MIGVFDSILGGSWQTWFCVITALFLSFNYFARTLLFLSVATAHYYRVYLMLTFLSRLLRIVPETYPNFPVVQLRYVQFTVLFSPKKSKI